MKLALLVALGVLAVFAAAGAASAASGDAYGGSGDWAINSATTYDAEDIPSITGTVDIYSDLVVDGSTFTFDFGAIYVHSGGSITLRNSTITTSDTSVYYAFVIEDGASTSYIYDTTLEYVDGGLTIYGGSHDVAWSNVWHGLGYGVHLIDSDASLSHLGITVDTIDAYTYSYEENLVPPYQDQWGYTYDYQYYYTNQSWSAFAAGVATEGGSPAIDTLDISITNVYSVVYAYLGGHYIYTYSFATYPYTYKFQEWMEYDVAGFEIYGFRGVGSTFTKFVGVAPVIDDVTAEIHATLTESSGYVYDYGWFSDMYLYDYESWSNNYLSLASTVVSIYLEDAGLTNINGLDITMGDVTLVFYNDWSPSYNYYVQYWEDNRVNFGASQILGLWSVENTLIAVNQAITPTSVTLSNSILRRAGVRVDRFYTYTATNPTIFRGTVLVDNVTVIDSPSTGVILYLEGTATQTFQTYDFTVEVKNSYFDGARSFDLNVLNKPTTSTDFTANFRIHDNIFLNGNVHAGNNFDGIITVDTGGHASNLAGDTYSVDFRLYDNTLTDMVGPLFGFDYSNYKFNGTAMITFENNILENIEPYSDSLNEAMIKTTMNVVALRNNTFTNYSYVYGFLGGKVGADNYYEWSLHFTQPQYYEAHSWPYKTPLIIVDGNTFEHAEMITSSQYSVAFINFPGRGHAIFSNNTINDSDGLWVNLMLDYYDYYRFPIEDLDVHMQGNVISNHTGYPVVRYLDPYKSGQEVRMIGNTLKESDQMLFDWSQLISFFSPTEYKASLTLVNNSFIDITGDAIHLTGRTIVTGNMWDGVTGWCLRVDWMSKVPDLATNIIHASGNGYQFIPKVISGLVTTSTFSDLVIDVSGTGIQMSDGNMLIFRTDFGSAAVAVDIKDGYAEVYSSIIRILSGRVQGAATIDVFNDVGYNIHWADANGVDAGVPVNDALLVMFTSDNLLAGSGRSDAFGAVPPKTVEVWKMTAFGSLAISNVYLPLNVIVTRSGITKNFLMPQVPAGGSIEFFQDQPAYPVLLIDYAVPTISIGSPLVGETVGSTNVVISGYTFERGSGIAYQRVRVDNGPWVNIAAASTTWTITVPGVGEGAHTIHAEVADIATNQYSVALNFFVDVTPPTLTLTSPLEETTLTNLAVFDIRGHVEPVDSIVALNGIVITPNSRGDFFFNYSLADGLNVLRFTATDAAANQAVLVRTIAFDRYAPFLQVDSPVNLQLTNLVNIDVLGRSERDARVTVNGLPAFVNPIDGSFALQQLVLDDLFDQTENLLVIRAVDPAGNVRYENRTVIVDTKAPSIDLDLDADQKGRIEAGLPLSATTLDVKGTTDSSDARLTIGGQPITLTGRSFSRILVLREGLNVIPITSADLAGNTRELVLRVVRDTLKPVLTLESPAEPSLLTNQTTLLVTGYTDTLDSIISVVYTDARGIRVTDAVPTVPVGLPIQYRFEYTLVLVTDGNEHSVEVRASDLAGNFDAATFTYTAKVGKPFLEIVGFKTQVKETFIWINGTTEAGISRVNINGQEFEVAGQFFAVRWQLPITQGNYTFTVSVRDAAGNINTWTNRTQVDVHTEVPPPPVKGGISTELQIGIGAGLLGLGLATLVFAIGRRKEVE